VTHQLFTLTWDNNYSSMVGRGTRYGYI